MLSILPKPLFLPAQRCMSSTGLAQPLDDLPPYASNVRACAAIHGVGTRLW